MKKIMILIIVSLALHPAGCKKKESEEPAPAVSPPSAPEVTAGSKETEPQASTDPEGKENAVTLPSTIDEAVDFILSEMKEEDKKTIKETPKKDLIKYHHGFGTAVRNKLGLWSGNSKLLEATGKQHPDDASMVIIEALWERLQKP